MNESRSRTFQMCKEFADEMRLVLPSLMNREDLETKFSKLSLHLACCSRLAQQTEELAASMSKHGFMPSGAIHVKPNGCGKFMVVRGHHRLAGCTRRGNRTRDRTAAGLRPVEPHAAPTA